MSASIPPQASSRRIRLPGVRQVLFQLHWFFGITAGTLLIVIGLTGATLAFRDEIVDAITPGGRHVPAAATPALTPQQLVQIVHDQQGHRQIAQITVSTEPGRAARVGFAPPPGQRRGETAWLNPYTGEVLPPLRAEPFFEWVESLHRWLLLPREEGRIVAGILAGSLLLLSLSGLYLRWPRHPSQWRAWLTFDTRLKGRSFLWGLHAVVGTVSLVVYLMFTATGLYWAFDWVRDPVDRMAGDPRPAQQAQAPRPPRAAGEKPKASPPADMGPAWQAFVQRADASGGWQEASLRVPNGNAKGVQFNWLSMNAPHERARNRMTVSLSGTDISQDDRYADRPAGARALTVIYPLHLGHYFGIPGRIVNMSAALMLPLFAITGWMLYLDRRRKKREIARQQAALAGTAAPTVPGHLPVLVSFASQTGTAEGIALRSAAMLRATGCAVTVLPFADLQAERLRHFERVLLVASSFGEGEPPDSARRVARLLSAAAAPALGHLQYGLLALGDRHYERFCGFGHALDHSLESAGATRLFPMIEVDDGDPAALAAWQQALAALAGAATPTDLPSLAPVEAPVETWQLVERTHLNPGSLGAPLYQVELLPLAGASMHWSAGALVEVFPRHAAQVVRPLLESAGFDAAMAVQHPGMAMTLADALASSALPTAEVLAASAGRPQALADALPPLAGRRYSVASLPAEGRLRLLVRQARREGGLGIASGWLTEYAPLLAEVSLRLLPNPAFAPVQDDAPAIFIGNGSGYAGLLGHLLDRIANGRERNWVVFGERQRAVDAFCAEELGQWLAQGLLEKVDLVFSRDQAERLYVQDRLLAEADLVRRWVGEGACLYVCGSLEGMAAGVDAALVDILGADGMDDLIASGRYRRDVY